MKLYEALQVEMSARVVPTQLLGHYIEQRETLYNLVLSTSRRLIF
jgi:hypothetical protein